MAKPRVLILRAPGTNCDIETGFAFEQVGAEVTAIHVNSLMENPQAGRGFQILCFPGGFSYGDDIAAGRILAQRLQTHLSDLIQEFRQSDKLILGICNGFQIMMRLGVFFPGQESAPPATLTLNRQARFEDRWVPLVADRNSCVFLRGIERMYLPMAHAEGRLVIRNEDSKQSLLKNSQLGLRYCAEDGAVSESTLPYPSNPNGADLNVAGISDPTGKIFGLMPHPERHIEPTQHPYWTRRTIQPAQGDGLAIFANAVSYFE
jgi:phosphoribosylformylglycinamidine synthase subunit PurQ / glutaminase